MCFSSANGTIAPSLSRHHLRTWLHDNCESKQQSIYAEKYKITVFTSILSLSSYIPTPGVASISPLETSSFAQKERILSPRMALFTLNLTVVLKSTQINMIFSYKNYINKRHLKPLLLALFW